MKQIPVTHNFKNDEPPIGFIRIDDESQAAKLVLDNISEMVFAPEYIEHKDGTVELLAISAIPADHVKKSEAKK